jgi:hypothetical protein
MKLNVLYHHRLALKTLKFIKNHSEIICLVISLKGYLFSGYSLGGHREYFFYPELYVVQDSSGL